MVNTHPGLPKAAGAATVELFRKLSSVMRRRWVLGAGRWWVGGVRRTVVLGLLIVEIVRRTSPAFHRGELGVHCTNTGVGEWQGLPTQV